MSANKTENLKLHQWSLQDPVSLSEVNANFTALDEAVQEALRERIAVGAYTGAEEEVTIEVGWRPRCVLICGTVTVTGGAVAVGTSGYTAMTVGNVLTDHVVLTDTGFTVLIDTFYPKLTEEGRVYDWVALR